MHLLLNSLHRSPLNGRAQGNRQVLVLARTPPGYPSANPRIPGPQALLKGAREQTFTSPLFQCDCSLCASEFLLQHTMSFPELQGGKQMVNEMPNSFLFYQSYVGENK